MRNRLEDLSSKKEKDDDTPKTASKDSKKKGGDDDTVLEMSNLGPTPSSTEAELADFLKEVNLMKKQLARMEKVTEEYTKAVAQMQEAGLRAQEQAKATYEAKEKEMKSVMEQISKKLKELDQRISQKKEEELAEDPSGKTKSTLLRVMTNQHAALGRHFKDLMKEFGQQQGKKDNILYTGAKRALQMVGEDDSEANVQMIVKTGKKVFISSVIDEHQQGMANMYLADAEEQRDKIRDIVTSLYQLRELVIDLAVLVEKQGELLDQIEFNVNQAKAYVQEGNKEMVKAKEYQTSARNKQCCIIVIIVVVAVVVVLATVGGIGAF